MCGLSTIKLQDVQQVTHSGSDLALANAFANVESAFAAFRLANQNMCVLHLETNVMYDPSTMWYHVYRQIYFCPANLGKIN